MGKKISTLVVIEEIDGHLGNQRRKWLCMCNCGKTRIVRADTLSAIKRGAIARSCYHVNRRKHERHGQSKTRTYKSWRSMIERCTNPHNISYKRYGAKGVTICNDWSKGFPAFLRDMGERPQNTSLGRIDGDKGYYPSNCKWQNNKEQVAEREKRNARRRN